VTREAFQQFLVKNMKGSSLKTIRYLHSQEVDLLRHAFGLINLPGVVAVLATLFGLTPNPAAAAETNRYNVLFIAVDDLRTELGCYGVDYVRSPHLDRLASQGVLFTHHYVQVPTCGASRYAMLTGRSPARTRVFSSNEALYNGPAALAPEQSAGAQSLPELFRRSGYRTVCIGKISHTPDGRVFAYNGTGDGRPELPHAWDELATPLGPWGRGWGAFFAYTGGRHREDGQGHRDVMEFVAERDEDLPDGLMAARAIEQLRTLRESGRRFFLGLGFFKPHLPFVATKADWEAMEKIEVPPPPHPEKPNSDYWHRSAEFYGYNLPFPKTNPLEAADQLRARRAYLACVRYSDRQVGKVLAALDTLGLADSTIVVLWGDNGWHLGDSQLWGKHTPFERALRTPLIIRAPGISRAGTRCDALVESLDLYPTLVDLCRPSFTRTQYPLDGLSLRPLLDGSARSLREAAVSYWGGAVTVRTITHRLIVTRTGSTWSGKELYDMRQTPDPVENLAARQPDLVNRLLGFVPATADSKGRTAP
jgi:arylsulfatase A-like enzyme